MVVEVEESMFEISKIHYIDLCYFISYCRGVSLGTSSMFTSERLSADGIDDYFVVECHVLYALCAFLNDVSKFTTLPQ